VIESALSPRSFFVAGGTLPDEAESYVRRAADNQLLSALLGGRFCYVLNSRQMGKSSLCVRIMRQLDEQRVRTAFVDLTKIGGRNVTPDQWYAGIAIEIGRSLGMRDAVLAYFKGHEHLSPVQRLFGAIREVALEQLDSPLVVFFDEIDATRSLPFNADEFFAAIRECYNRRVRDKEYNRLSFCLLGVAVPSDLINSTTSTPFNVGERIYLRDFTLEEAAVLAKGFESPVRNTQDAKHLLERIYYWTNGHPFLTQSVCQAVANDPDIRIAADVDALVDRDLFNPKARETNINLADVANRALHIGDLERDPEKFRADLLSMYQRAWRGKPVADDESNRVAALLKLSGIMRVDGNRLLVRNRIYERVFDREWIRENMPKQELRRQRRAFWVGVLRTGGIAAAVLAVIGYLAYRNSVLAAEANRQANEKEYEAYIADVNLMRSAYDDNDLPLIRQLLDRTRNSTHRNLEWSFWNAAVHDAEQEIDYPPATGGTVMSADGKEIGLNDSAGHSFQIRSTEDLHLIAQRDHMAGHDNPEYFAGRFVFVHFVNPHLLSIRDAITNSELFKIGPVAGSFEDGRSSASGKCILTVLREPGEVTALTALIFDGRTGELLHRVRTAGRINTAFVSDDGKVLATEEVHHEAASIVNNYFATRWIVARDTTTGNVIDSWQTGGVTNYVTTSSDGQFLAACSDNGDIIVRNIREHKETARVFEPVVSAVKFSLDDKRLSVRSINLDARLVDLQSGATLARGRGAYDSAITPDGKKLFVIGYGTRVYSESNRNVNHIKIPYTWAKVEHFSPKGYLAITTGAAVRVLDPVTMKEIHAVRMPVAETSVSAFGEVFCVPNGKGGTDIFAVDDGRKVCHISLGEIQYMDATQGANRIAAAALAGRTVGVFDSSGKELWTQTIGEEMPRRVRWSGDGAFLALGTFSGKIFLFNGATGKLDRILSGPTESVADMAFSKDGRWLAVASFDMDVYAFNLQNGKAVIARGHSAGPSTIRFSNDGSRFVTASDDGTVRMWDTETGRQTLMISSGAYVSIGVTLAPDESALYASTGAGVITKYPLLKPEGAPTR